MGLALGNVGKHDDAVVTYKEALEISTTMSAQDLLLAKTLRNYGFTLTKLNQVSKAAAVRRQAISYYCNLAQTGNEWTTSLCDALHDYGSSYALLGQHEEAVLAFQESILLRHALATRDSEEESKPIRALHRIAYPLLALDRHTEANTTANEAMERNHGKVLKCRPRAPSFHLDFVCKGVMTTGSLGDSS